MVVISTCTQSPHLSPFFLKDRRLQAIEKKILGSASLDDLSTKADASVVTTLRNDVAVAATTAVRLVWLHLRLLECRQLDGCI